MATMVTKTYTYQERLDALRETKLRATKEKQEIIGSMDYDDWALILPPPEYREVVETISGSQDTHRGDLNISAVFGEEEGKFFPSILGTVPPTGTKIRLVGDSVLDRLLERYRSQIFYLGRVYGSTPKLPLTTRPRSSI